jgi:ectoine hydroxylase-related dioxygenase (phytanoyl-CoA dioxygenase family)
MFSDVEMHETNGFVIIRECIELQLILDAQSYAAEFLKCDASAVAIIKAMEDLESENKSYFYEFCKRMGQSIPVIRIATQPKILNLVQEITKFKNLHLVDSAVFFNKLSIKRLQYDWHQEQAYFPNASEVMTMWYPWLMPVNSANGTMVMASGGHKKVFARERINVSSGLTQMKISEDDLQEFEKVECDLNLGDAVIFTFMSPHRTGHNSSGVPRTTIITRFTNAVGAYENGWDAE